MEVVVRFQGDCTLDDHDSQVVASVIKMLNVVGWGGVNGSCFSFEQLLLKLT